MIKDLRYIQLIKKTSESLFPVVCNNCGSKTLIQGNVGICTVCELVIIKEENDLQSKLFETVVPLLTKTSIPEATKALESLSKNANTPSSSYVIGVFYSILSDYAYFNLNYNDKGFMEENATNKYLSLDLTSKSKEFFFRALKLISNLEQKGDDNLYLEFISNIKLGRLFYALNSLKTLNTNKTEIYCNYANMVYAVESRRKDAEHFVRPMLSKSLNAFYYFSKVLAQKKQLEDAISILTFINQNINMPISYSYLIKLESILAAAGFN
jgi:tetratricopeptide (TPR) repeat protein